MNTLVRENPQVYQNGRGLASDLPGTAPDVLPPFDEDSERNILGGILIDNGLLPDVITKGVKPETFFIWRYGRIFDAMIRLNEAGQSIAPVTLASLLKVADSEGTDWLLECQQIESSTLSVYAALTCADIILEHARDRRSKDFRDFALNLLDMASIENWPPEKITAELQARAKSADDPAARLFQPLTFLDILSLPPKQWLIKDIIGPGDLGMIFGDSGTGKTFLVIDLILSAITGLSWARRFEIAEPLTVAYCTNEGLAGLPQRFQAAQQWYQASDEALQRFTAFPMLPQLFNADSKAYISRFVSDYKATRGDQLDLLIIDTLDNAALGSVENDNGDASVIADATRIARDALGCATILIHHAGKNGEYRGASAYKGDCDVMVKTERKADGSPYIEFSCYKSKDAEQFQPLVFTLYAPNDSSSRVIAWQGPASENLGKTNELLAAMEEMPGQRLTAKQWGEAIGVEQNHAIAILNDLRKKAKVERELQHPDKTKSSRNPFVYYFQS